MPYRRICNVVIVDSMMNTQCDIELDEHIHDTEHDLVDVNQNLSVFINK